MLKIRRTIEEDKPKENNTVIPHRFRLRKDFTVEIKLPENITQHEAERLAQAILTFPLGENVL